MAPFVIPGLTTLLEPQEPNATPAHCNNQDVTSNTAVSSGTEQVLASEAPVNAVSHDNHITSDENAVPKSSESADVPSITATAMEVDDVQPAQPDESAVVTTVDAPESPPSLTQGLEALLRDQEKSTDQQAQNGEDTAMVDNEKNVETGEAEHPEWEADSSPYESSSESSSSDDSDDDSDDSDDAKELNPEELARILMEAASDDEDDGKAKGAKSDVRLRTKNELPEEVIPKPDVTITPEMPIEELGSIQHIVENTIVIKANTTGEYKVLDSGSVLCTQDRTVIAGVADLIGTVHEPFYTALFTNDEEIKAFNLEVGTKVFYTANHATFVFTKPLQGTKGTDASNWHDEEVGDDEIEFSDDEQEQAHRRMLKEKKRQQRPGGRGGTGSSQGTSGRAESNQPDYVSSNALNYDDEDIEAGSYRKLARPSNYGTNVTGATATTAFTNGATDGYRNSSGNGSYRGGRGDSRGRGRGRGHDRGGRGYHRGPGGSGHSLPPRSQQFDPSLQQQTFPSYPPPPPQFANPAFPPPPLPFAHGTQQQPSFPSWPQGMPANFVPPPPPQFQQQQGGGYFNPAFYAAMQSQFQAQNAGQQPGQQSGQQPGQWNGSG